VTKLSVIGLAANVDSFCRFAEWAYCWQEGRFIGDSDFWSARLTQPENVKPVRSEKALSFLLSTAGDFLAFQNAVTTELASARWIATGPDLEASDEVVASRAAAAAGD